MQDLSTAASASFQQGRDTRVSDGGRRRVWLGCRGADRVNTSKVLQRNGVRALECREDELAMPECDCNVVGRAKAPATLAQ